MFARHAPFTLVSLFVLVAGSMLAVAQMGPNDDRHLPLEIAVTAEHRIAYCMRGFPCARLHCFCS